MELSKSLRYLYPGIDLSEGGECELEALAHQPDTIAAWRRPEKKPTETELQAAWAAYQAEQPAKEKATLIESLEAELVTAKAEAMAAAGLVSAGDLGSASRWTAREAQAKARLTAARG